MEYLENVPLAPKTTIRIGGPARYFAEVSTDAQICEAISWAQAQNLPLLILGGGSNLLLADSGFDGLVVHLNGTHIHKHIQPDREVWTVDAGMDWDQLVAATVAANLAGIECLSGIPGKVGASPIQNIGAYGQEVADVIESVRLLDRKDLSILTKTGGECAFGYRTSRFKHGPDAGRYVVLAVSFALKPKGAPTVRYPDLLKRVPDNPTLADVREAVLAVRGEKSMVTDPTDPNARSCGSFFTNPIIEEAAYQNFLGRDVGEHPSYPGGPGKVKLSAAWLIQNAGFPKGFVFGNVGLSEKHCLALINRNGGTAKEILALAENIQAGVKTRFGIHLEPEPILMGK